MDQSLCKLTLIYPIPAEEQILDLMLSNDGIVKGFTTWHGEGHGEAFDATSANEKVRGRVDRGVLVTILARSTVSELLEMVRKAIESPRLAFWVEPVEQFGHLVSAKAKRTSRQQCSLSRRAAHSA